MLVPRSVLEPIAFHIASLQMHRLRQRLGVGAQLVRAGAVHNSRPSPEAMRLFGSLNCCSLFSRAPTFQSLRVLIAPQDFAYQPGTIVCEDPLRVPLILGNHQIW